MANYQIPISYVVSASLVSASQGLEPLKMSTILLLTDETPVTALSEDYAIYRTASSVIKQWGTNSTVSQMANSIFGQQPNILANDGYVIVAPYTNVAATAGTLTTEDISANIANFKDITNGSLKLTVDGQSSQKDNLDFSGTENLTDITEVINLAFNNVTATVSGNTIVLTSSTTGNGSSVLISEATTEGTDIYGAEYLDGANVTTTQGTAQRVETTSEAVTRVAGLIYFNGILTARTLATSEAVATSNTVQAMTPQRIFFLESNTTDSLTAGTGLFAQVESNNYTKSLLYTYGDDSGLNAKLFASAYASRLFAVNYSGSNTCITMNLKDLSGIVADTNISETILGKCADLGVDVFPSVEGLAKVLSNKQGNFYIDQVQNQLWFVNSVQRNVFNLLATTRTKIPQTESGMQLITNAIADICKQGVTNGFIAPGTWNSADTFGVLEDFTRNIEENGYYIYHLPVSEQLQSEREQRKAPVFQIACKEAGAVHSANILIYVEA